MFDDKHGFLVNDKAKRKLKKFFIMAGIIVALILLVLLCYPLVVALFQPNSQATLMSKLKGFGVWTPLLFLLLQIMQIVIAFIPGEPLPAIGSILFGEDLALLFCLLGCLLGTGIVYYLVRRFGRALVVHFVPEKYFEKYNFILNSKKMYLLIFIVFLLPGLPKDILTYLVAFNPVIKPIPFLVLTTLGRAPAIAMTIYLGKSLWSGNVTLVVIILGFMLLLFIIGIMVKKRIENKHISPKS